MGTGGEAPACRRRTNSTTSSTTNRPAPQIARNAGFENYRDYAFRKLGRFDYTPDDCMKFHDAVEKEVVPVVRELQAQRRAQLKLEKLRPWDLAVDPLNRPPLKPFAEVGEMVSRTQRIFDSLDGELAGGFRRMQDLHFRPGQPQGQGAGRLSRDAGRGARAVHFMNAVGLQRDVETILHEAGHAFHALATRDEDLHAYRGAPIEFCEVASMSMELLGNEFIGGILSRSRSPPRPPTCISKASSAFFRGWRPWTRFSTGFTRIQSTARDERTVAWLKLMERFGGDVDWSGIRSRARQSLAPAAPHFHRAFYYIEYGIAQLGALQVWANSKRDKAKALSDYKKSLALAARVRCRNCFRRRAANLNSAKRQSSRWRKCAGRIGEALNFDLQPIRILGGGLTPLPQSRRDRVGSRIASTNAHMVLAFRSAG